MPYKVTNTKSETGRAANRQPGLKGFRRATVTMLAFGLLVGPTVATSAADRTWNGSASGQWTDTGNWDGGVIPGANDTAVLALGAANQTIDLGGTMQDVHAITFDSDTPYAVNNGRITLVDLDAIVSGGLITHRFNADVWLGAAGTWGIGEFQNVEVAGELVSINGLNKTGSGSLILSGDSGDTASNVSVSQGDMVLRGGAAYSDVGLLTVNANGTLRLDDNETIGGLAGGGAVELGDRVLRLTGTGSPAFAGAIAGSDDSKLVMSGPGQQTLTGIANVGKFDGNGGLLLLDGGTFTMPPAGTGNFELDGGIVEIRNGAVLNLPETGSTGNGFGLGLLENGSLQISDSGSQLRAGRVDIGFSGTAIVVVGDSGLLDVTKGTDPLIVVGNGVLQDTTGSLLIDSGGQVVTANAIAALFDGDEGTIWVDGQGSSFEAYNLLALGGIASAGPGGTGLLQVTNGATVLTEFLSIRSSTTSVTIDGGVLSVGSIEVPSGINPTIEISDPPSGSALTIGTDDQNSTLSGTIQDGPGGPGGIEKTGTGNLTLTANQLFGGGVHVTQGILRLRDAAREYDSLTGSGDVTLTNGTRVDGTGVIGGGLVAQSGATVEPGNENGFAIGTMDCGALELQSGSTLKIELGGASLYDQVNIVGTATLGGTLRLTYINGFTASEHDAFRILSADSFSGGFAGIIAPDGQNWVTYEADGSLFVKVCNDPATCIAPCAAEIDRYATGVDVFSSISDGNIVVVNRGPAGLEILAAPNPTFGAPLATIAGSVISQFGNKAIALDGNLLFVAGGTPRIYDVSDPAQPALLSTLNGYFAWDVAVQGSVLAVAHDQGLALFDISNPAGPVLQSDSLADSLSFGNVVFHEGLLYWNFQDDSFFGELVIVDVANPAMPAQLGSILANNFTTEPQFSSDVAIVSNVLGIRTIDVSDPANPTQIAFLSANSVVAGDVALEGALLIRADETAGLIVYDVSDPAAPFEVDRLSAYDGAHGLANRDGLLYVSRLGGGLALIDMNDADNDGVIGVCDVCPGFDDNIDSDGDGFADGCDNCPATANPDQADSEAPSPALSPVAAWHFDENDGTAVDAVAGYVGTLNNGAVWSANGRRGAAVEFPVGGGTVNVPGSTEFDTSDQLSVSLWVDPSAFPTNVNRFITRSSFVFRLQGGKPHFYVRQGGVNFGVRASELINTDDWTHLAAVWDGLGDGLPRIYINGVEASAYDFQEAVAAPIDSSGAGLTIGNAAGEPFEGLMDELAIFSKALTVTEIQDVFANGLGDGIGDACDVCFGDDATGDDDGDGVCNDIDACIGFDDNVDSDGDGIPDGCESPCGAQQLGDIDGGGTVDMADASGFAAVLIDPLAATVEAFCAADVNQDGAVNGLDIHGFMGLLLLP